MKMANDIFFKESGFFLTSELCSVKIVCPVSQLFCVFMPSEFSPPTSTVKYRLRRLIYFIRGV